MPRNKEIEGVSSQVDGSVLPGMIELPVEVAPTEQAGAMGAAMCVATAAGLFDCVEDAQHQMKSEISKTYFPDKKVHRVYNRLYQQYLMLGSL